MPDGQPDGSGFQSAITLPIGTLLAAAGLPPPSQRRLNGKKERLVPLTSGHVTANEPCENWRLRNSLACTALKLDQGEKSLLNTLEGFQRVERS